MPVYAVGEMLRGWRHRRRLSQLDLAIAADVSARHVSLVETGRSRPSADMILRLADQLGVGAALGAQEGSTYARLHASWVAQQGS